MATGRVFGKPASVRQWLSIWIEPNHSASIFSPCRLGIAAISRTFLAVGNDPDTRFGNTKPDQRRLYRGGPLFAKRKIIIAGAAFVTMPLDKNGAALVNFQRIRDKNQSG